MHRMILKAFNRTDKDFGIGTGRLPLWNSIAANFMNSYNFTTNSSSVSSTSSPLEHTNLNSSYDDYLRFLINSKYLIHNNNSNNNNFFYQHVFNFSLVLIFLLQVLLVWTFLCRKKRRQEENEFALHLELGNVPDIALFMPPQQPGQVQTAPAPAG